MEDLVSCDNHQESGCCNLHPRGQEKFRLNYMVVFLFISGDESTCNLERADEGYFLIILIIILHVYIKSGYLYYLSGLRLLGICFLSNCYLHSSELLGEFVSERFCDPDGSHLL